MREASTTESPRPPSFVVGAALLRERTADSPANSRLATGDGRPATEDRESRAERGFTLLELIIVVAVIGILATIAMPRMLNTPMKAREAVLKTNLRTMRDTIDQYYGDKGHYPSSLEVLVDEGYLRAIPVDPITQSTETWVPVFQEEDFEDVPAETDLPEDGQPGLWDVKSGAEGTTMDGVPYSEL